MAALFFAEMRYDPRDPANPDNDRFVLSKGHAAPILYAAWAEAGIIERERPADAAPLRLGSRRAPDAAAAVGRRRHRVARTGDLCAGVGIALNARRIASDYRTYVLLGDGETAEGSVWEAADVGVLPTGSIRCAASPTSTRSARAADAVAARHGGARRPVARLRLAHDRRRRSRHAGGPRRARRGASARGAGRR